MAVRQIDLLVSEGSLRHDSQPTVFYSHRQLSATGMTLFARTNRPAAIATLAVDAIHRLDPNLAVTRVRTFEGALTESVARERLNALVSAGFAFTGLLLPHSDSTGCSRSWSPSARKNSASVSRSARKRDD